MSLNVSNVDRTQSVRYASLQRYDGSRFVQNSTEGKVNLNQPETRTNYSADDNRGINLYCLG